MLEKNMLETWFQARVYDSDRYRYSYPVPMDLDRDRSVDTLTSWPPANVVPCKEVVLMPHQYERLLGVLGEITSPDRTYGVDATNPMVRYSENVARQQEYEARLRRENPMLQSLWDQYQAALKLCR